MIRHEFDRPSGAGRQLLRIQPAEMPILQSLLSCDIAITPEPSERREFTDFCGTRVLEVVMAPGLKKIEIVMKAFAWCACPSGQNWIFRRRWNA